MFEKWNENTITFFPYICDYYSAYFAFSKINSLTNNKIKSTTDCGSFGDNKILTLKKAFSESVERRSMVAFPGKKDKVKVLDLLEGSISHINKNNFFFSLNKKTDTTGSAVNSNCRKAIEDSMLELIEKNATVLFWYKNNGYRTNSRFLRSKVNEIIDSKYNYEIYITDSFKPINVAFVAVYKDDKLLIIGTGAGESNMSAVVKAANEAMFLNYVDKNEIPVQQILQVKQDNYTYLKQKALLNPKTVKKLHQYPIYNIVQEKQDNHVNKKMDLIKLSLSEYTKHVYLYLQRTLNLRLVSAKVYSPDLVNYVPFKMNLNDEAKILKQLKNIKIDDSFPELPIM